MTEFDASKLPVPESWYFEYDEEQTVAHNFVRLVKEALDIEPFAVDSDSWDAAITYKGEVVIIHLTVGCPPSDIRIVMYLFYWFMEEYFHHFPGERPFNVLQTLE